MAIASSKSKRALDYVQNRYEYILVDEFQDTNILQYDLIKTIGEKHKNIFVVGDDDQSIYAFRGACVGKFLSFEKDYENCKIIYLNNNYRSTQKILDKANKLIQVNSTRKEKGLKAVFEHNDTDVVFNGFNEDYLETAFVGEEIRVLISNGIRPSDIAILYRTNLLSKNFELQLSKYNIPYKVYGGRVFFDATEIKDFIDILRFIIIDNNNILAFKRIYKIFTEHVGKSTYIKISDCRKQTNRTILEIIDLIIAGLGEFRMTPKITNQIKNFKKYIFECKNQYEEKGIIEVAKLIATNEQFIKHIKTGKDNIGERLEKINDFVNLLAKEEIDSVDKLIVFFDRVCLSNSQDIEVENSSVTLSTIHSAKGLEFDYVFIVAMEEGVFPKNRLDQLKTNEIEEERRVAYVGITRARIKLYISFAVRRQLSGHPVTSGDSIFYKELSENKYISNKGLVKIDVDISDTRRRNLYEKNSKVIHLAFGKGVILSKTKNEAIILFHSDNKIRKISLDHIYLGLDNDSK